MIVTIEQQNWSTDAHDGKWTEYAVYFGDDPKNRGVLARSRLGRDQAHKLATEIANVFGGGTIRLIRTPRFLPDPF